MDRTFDGQVALVTGGGKGIGLGVAKALADRGAKVAVTGRHPETLESAVNSLTGGGLALAMDVREEESVRRGVQAAIDWGGKLDIVVNNAGIGLLETPLLETTAEAWRDVLETNLTGAFFVTKAAWPHLVASKGQVLNVSSISGTQGFIGASAYCASKFGLNGLTEVLKKEGTDVGIRVMAICPGAADTDIWSYWASDDERSRMMTSDQLGELAVAMLGAPRNVDLGALVVVNAVSPWKA